MIASICRISCQEAICIVMEEEPIWIVRVYLDDLQSSARIYHTVESYDSSIVSREKWDNLCLCIFRGDSISSDALDRGYELLYDSLELWAICIDIES